MVGGPTSGVSKKRTAVPRAAQPGWLKRMDQRSRVARALHERLAIIGEDLGGLDQLSGIQRSLLERFLHAEALAAELEERARNGQPFDVGRYLAITDRVVRLAHSLGLQRRPRNAKTLAEVLAEARNDSA